MNITYAELERVIKEFKEKFNPNHDPNDGRFTSGGGGGGGGGAGGTTKTVGRGLRGRGGTYTVTKRADGKVSYGLQKNRDLVVVPASTKLSNSDRTLRANVLSSNAPIRLLKTMDVATLHRLRPSIPKSADLHFAFDEAIEAALLRKLEVDRNKA